MGREDIKPIHFFSSLVFRLSTAHSHHHRYISGRQWAVGGEWVPTGGQRYSVAIVEIHWKSPPKHEICVAEVSLAFIQT